MGAWPASGQCPPRYDVEIIQAAPCQFGVFSAMGHAINEAGEIAGEQCTCLCASTAAFHWDGDGPTTTLAFPPGTFYSEAYDISDSGAIIGDFDLNGDGFDSLAFYRSGATFINLGTIPGGIQSHARAINSQNDIVGYGGSQFVVQYPQALLWTGGTIVNIQDSLPAFPSSAEDINDAAQVTGWMGSFQKDARAFVWADGSLTELPPIPGGYTSEGYAISDDGKVVGRGRLASDVHPTGWARHAFLWTNAEMFDLGTLPNCIESRAHDVNAAATVVGSCNGGVSKPNYIRAFMWSDGLMHDLNDLVPIGFDLEIQAATGINEQGVITGWGIFGGVQGAGVAVRLTPIARLVADMTCDGLVDSQDLRVLLEDWGGAGPGDIDRSGTVDGGDLGLLLLNWDP